MYGLTPAEMKVEVLRHLDPRATFSKSAAGTTTTSRADPFFSDATIEDSLTASKWSLWSFLTEHSPRQIATTRTVVALTTSNGVVRIDPPAADVPAVLRLLSPIEDVTGDLGPPRFPIDLVDDDVFLARSARRWWNGTTTAGLARYRNGALELAGPPTTDRTLELSVVLEPQPIRLVDPNRETELPPQFHRTALVYGAVLDLMGREQRESETYQRMEARLQGALGAIVEASLSRTGAQTFMPVYTRR